MKKYSILIFFFLHTFFLGACGNKEEPLKTQSESKEISEIHQNKYDPQQKSSTHARQNSIKEELRKGDKNKDKTLEEEKPPTVQGSGSEIKNGSEIKDGSEIKAEELKDKKIIYILAPGTGAKPDYFTPFVSAVNSNPTLKKLKENKFHHPTFDNSGKISLKGQADAIVNGLPKNLKDYDFIVISGQSMGGSVAWFVLEALAKKGLTKKLTLFTFAAPNPKTGVPITVNGKAVLAIADLPEQGDFITKMLLQQSGFTAEKAQGLKELVNNEDLGFASFLNENAGQGTKDLRPGSPALKNVLQIMKKYAPKVPCKGFVGVDDKGRFEKMLPMLPLTFLVVAKKLICEKIDPTSIINLLTQFATNNLPSANLKSDGLVPKGPELPFPIKELNGYHDHTMTPEGKIEETVHGLGANPAAQFVAASIKKKIKTGKKS